MSDGPYRETPDLVPTKRRQIVRADEPSATPERFKVDDYDDGGVVIRVGAPASLMRRDGWIYAGSLALFAGSLWVGPWVIVLGLVSYVVVEYLRAARRVFEIVVDRQGVIFRRGKHAQRWRLDDVDSLAGSPFEMAVHSPVAPYEPQLDTNEAQWLHARLGRALERVRS